MAIRPSLEQMQRKGFPMGGEPLVAVDLVDTLMKAVDPPVDLLQEKAGDWWGMQLDSLPDDTQPAASDAARLRAALREAFEARIDDRPPASSAIDDLNHFAESATTSPQVFVEDDGSVQVVTRWHPKGESANLAAIAMEGIGLLSDHDRARRLRRCANPNCSMIFLAERASRVWCTANICGNRARVARHYQRQQNT